MTGRMTRVVKIFRIYNTIQFFCVLVGGVIVTSSRLGVRKFVGCIM